MVRLRRLKGSSYPWGLEADGLQVHLETNSEKISLPPDCGVQSL